MNSDADDFVAVRRRRDGLYLRGPGQWGEVARFLPSRARAEMVIRIDLGDDLADYEIISRDVVKGLRR